MPAQAIDVAALKAAGIVKRAKDGVRLLGGAAPKAKLNISVVGASRSAIAAVEKAGGSVSVSGVGQVARRSPGGSIRREEGWREGRRAGKAKRKNKTKDADTSDAGA